MEYVECLRRYERQFGENHRPEAGEMPSIDQLSALRGLLRAKVVPYVDSASFGHPSTSPWLRPSKRRCCQCLSVWHR